MLKKQAAYTSCRILSDAMYTPDSEHMEIVLKIFGILMDNMSTSRDHLSTQKEILDNSIKLAEHLEEQCAIS